MPRIASPAEERVGITPLVTQHPETVRARCRAYGVARVEVFGSAITDAVHPATSGIGVILEDAPDDAFGIQLTRSDDLKERLETLLSRPVGRVMVGAIRYPRFLGSVNETRHCSRRRDILGLLEDIDEAAGLAVDDTAGMSSAAWQRDRRPPRTVARNFEVIGQAVNPLDHHSRDRSAQIAARRQIIGLRSALVHGADAIGRAGRPRAVSGGAGRDRAGTARRGGEREPVAVGRPLAEPVREHVSDAAGGWNRHRHSAPAIASPSPFASAPLSLVRERGRE